LQQSFENGWVTLASEPFTLTANQEDRERASNSVFHDTGKSGSTLS
jgi:hypothetical protein